MSSHLGWTIILFYFIRGDLKIVTVSLNIISKLLFEFFIASPILKSLYGQNFYKLLEQNLLKQECVTVFMTISSLYDSTAAIREKAEENQCWLVEFVMHRNDDPLLWWKSNNTHFHSVCTLQAHRGIVSSALQENWQTRLTLMWPICWVIWQKSLRHGILTL